MAGNTWTWQRNVPIAEAQPGDSHQKQRQQTPRTLKSLEPSKDAPPNASVEKLSMSETQRVKFLDQARYGSDQRIMGF